MAMYANEIETKEKEKLYLRLKINYNIYLVWSNHKADNRHVSTGPYTMHQRPSWELNLRKICGNGTGFVDTCCKFLVQNIGLIHFCT